MNMRIKFSKTQTKLDEDIYFYDVYSKKERIAEIEISFGTVKVRPVFERKIDYLNTIALFSSQNLTNNQIFDKAIEAISKIPSQTFQNHLS